MPSAASSDPLRERVEQLEEEVAALRNARRRLLEGADADRRAIEREIHDGILQDLAAFAIDLRRLSGLLDRDRASAQALIDKLGSEIRGTLDRASALAERIYPPLLESRGLASALRSAAQGSGLTLVADVPLRAAFPPVITAAVYWSCVAALSSAPPGSQATVRLREGDGMLTLEIATAGLIGDDRLDRLRDRIEALDGRVRVDRGKDGGSLIQARLPSSD